jgi:hypothetical protein
MSQLQRCAWVGSGCELDVSREERRRYVQKRPWPWRMLVRGAFQEGWSFAPQEEKNDVFREWIGAHRRCGEVGCLWVRKFGFVCKSAG